VIVATSIDFWPAMLVLFVWVPLVMAWVFVFFDLFRRDDMSGPSKALWLVVVVLFPVFGTVAYLARRSARTPAPDAASGEDHGQSFHWQFSRLTSSTLRALQLLSELHDAGKLTDAEFADQKRKLLAA
jgi:hypothetical protein